MTNLLKGLREKTGAGVVECKTALLSAGGDVVKAEKDLVAKMRTRAGTMSERSAKVIVVGSYVHHNGSVGAMAKLATQTDFVARTQVVKDLAKDIAMQVVANGTVTRSLLSEPWIRDPTVTVKDRVAQISAQVGEKIAVKRVARI